MGLAGYREAAFLQQQTIKHSPIASHLAWHVEASAGFDLMAFPDWPSTTLGRLNA